MYVDKDDEDNDNDERIYAAYYNDGDDVEPITAVDVQDSDMDSDQVDRLYSQIYHEMCDETDIPVSASGHSLLIKHCESSSFPTNKGIQSTAYTNQHDHDCFTQFTKVKPGCNTDHVRFLNTSTPKSNLILKGMCIDRAKDRNDDLNVVNKNGNSGISTLRPDLKTMLLDRSVDMPDSDTDHIECIYNRNTINSSMKCATVKVKQLKSVDKSESGNGNYFDKFDRVKVKKLDSDESETCSNKCEKLEVRVKESDKFNISELGASASKRENDCIVVSSDSSLCENKKTKKNVKLKTSISNVKKPTPVSNVIVLDESSNSSDSESSSDDTRDNDVSRVTVSSDSSSRTLLTSSELSDSTSSDSFSESLEDLRGNIHINVNRSQQHFVDSTMDGDSKGDLGKKEESILWSICDRDRFGGKILNGRYYRPSTVKCHNCNEVGHLSKHCPTPKMVACILCGLGGHYFRHCPNALCYNCDAPGHDARDCSQRRRQWHNQCTRCGMQGHHSLTCPDIWRQYHLTTTGDLKVPAKQEKPNPRVYCYNCARAKHFGHECHNVRHNQHSLPTYPFVAYYGEFKENESQRGNKGFGKQKGTAMEKKATFKSSDAVDFPRSTTKPILSRQIFKKKRKLEVEGPENHIAEKRYKINHKQLQEENLENVLKNSKKKKRKNKNFKVNTNEGIIKNSKNKRKPKIGGAPGEVEEDTTQNVKHQVNDNEWWTEKYKVRQEKRRKKRERRKVRNLENPELKKKKNYKWKASATNPRPSKTVNQEYTASDRKKSSFKFNFKNYATKPKRTKKGFFISKVAQNIMDR
ncbi:zinc finger CCHC domain-containing protein 7-like isoform X2 [Gigantopelta aegis]|uniref:zinc finger CCHC domain-containing protein 7-like isoform X2 n=1 Tax=Gigantopelta aegis TaxID=1735272 RepID=UPI001B88A4EE|nr:zinc finger CCHC domain-containing protein 7-like isoform X2 [Gigantopelta aegis]